MYFKEESLPLAYGLYKAFGILECQPVLCEVTLYRGGGFHLQMQRASIVFAYPQQGLSIYSFVIFFIDIYCELRISVVLRALS